MKKIFALLSLLTVSLSACAIPTALEPTTYISYEEFPVIKQDIETKTYYRLENYSPLEYGQEGNRKEIKTLRDIYSSGANHFNAPSTGKIKALVIPVNFKDSDVTKNKKQKILIQNAFFGRKTKTTFESLASFYDKASYGQLEFTGFITDFYNYPYSSSEFGSGTSSVSSKIATAALKWFYKNYPDEDMSEYDSDGDEKIDTLFILYNHPYDNSSSSSLSSLWWAYADHLSLSQEGNETKPQGSSYAWLSLYFLEAKYNYTETHVAVHESSHLFGLSDYYNTNSSAHFQPTGYLDMMDRNIGDHTAYSKMLLNWTTPYVPKDSGEITLKPFSQNGDLLLIPTNKGWNETPYDEYLLLEYYTPTGNNKADAGTKYVYEDKNGGEGVFSFLSKPGVKIYHVDSRVGYFDSRNNHNLKTIIGNEDELDVLAGLNNYCLDFAFTNTISDSKANKEPVLYHLLEASGENTFLDSIPGNDETLFHAGDTFGVNTFKDFTFNNGSPLSYQLEIKEMNASGVTIAFTKK